MYIKVVEGHQGALYVFSGPLLTNFSLLLATLYKLTPLAAHMLLNPSKIAAKQKVN